MARVPAGELAAEIIGRVRLTLRRVKEEARVARLGPEPLAQQFEELPVAVSDASTAQISPGNVLAPEGPDTGHASRSATNNLT